MIYHVLNRGKGRRRLFSKEADYAVFLEVLAEGIERFDVDLLAYCVLPDHWHLLLRPRTDQGLSKLMAWVTVTHARRHHQHHPSPGSGHIYRGRFKSFPVQADGHFLTVARYVHANPVRAGLAGRGRDWPWSDLTAAGRRRLTTAAWPVKRPGNWARSVDRTEDESEVAAIRASLDRGRPFGSAKWVGRTAASHGLMVSVRARGRPRRPAEELSERYRRRREAEGTEKSG